MDGQRHQRSAYTPSYADSDLGTGVIVVEIVFVIEPDGLLTEEIKAVTML